MSTPKISLKEMRKKKPQAETKETNNNDDNDSDAGGESKQPDKEDRDKDKDKDRHRDRNNDTPSRSSSFKKDKDERKDKTAVSDSDNDDKKKPTKDKDKDQEYVDGKKVKKGKSNKDKSKVPQNKDSSDEEEDKPRMFKSKIQQPEENNTTQSIEPSTLNPSSLRHPPQPTSQTLRSRLRLISTQTPELHCIGEICSFLNTTQNNDNIESNESYSIKYFVEYGKCWDLLEGETVGQSHYGSSSESNGMFGNSGSNGVENVITLNHPLDVHFTTSSIQGWPRIRVQLWSLDTYGLTKLKGYGFTHIPTTPGNHSFSINLWRPTGSLTDEISNFFIGGSPQLVDEQVVFGKAWENRCRLVTVPVGKVVCEVGVVLRFFEGQKIDL